MRRVIKGCIKCRKYQKMGDLPEGRISANQPPFTTTGVDLFGPFYTRKASSQVKNYGAMFTCLTLRAVHVEIAGSLSTDSFINALRRVIARRGQVKSLYCDKGLNFVGEERELKEGMREWNQSPIS